MIKNNNKSSYKTLCWVKKDIKKWLERLGLGPKTLLKVGKFYFHLCYFGLLSSSLFNDIIINNKKYYYNIEKKEKKFYTQQSEGRSVSFCRNKLDIFIIRIWHSKYKNYYIFLISFLNNLFFINLFSGNLFTGNISIIFSAQDVKNIGVAILHNIDQQSDVVNVDGNTGENNDNLEVIDVKEEEKISYWDEKVSVLGYETSRKTVAISTGVIVVISIITIGITIWYYKSGGNILVENENDEESLKKLRENILVNELTTDIVKYEINKLQTEIDDSYIFGFIKEIAEKKILEEEFKTVTMEVDYNRINEIFADIAKQALKSGIEINIDNKQQIRMMYNAAVEEYYREIWDNIKKK